MSRLSAESAFARLYPAAIACAVVNLAVLIPFGDFAVRYGLAVNATPAAFLASVVLIKGPFLVGALWTLPVEIGFYALVAVLIWRGAIGRPVLIASALILWSSLYLIPFCLSQYGLVPFSVRPLGYGLLNLTMLRHGCFFGVGILLWVSTKRNATVAHHTMLALGIALCAVEIVARVAELRDHYGHAVDQGALGIGALATFLLAVLGIWLFCRLNEVVRPSPAARTIMRHLGLVTYPLYLMHEGVGGVTSSVLQSAGCAQGLALLAGLASSLLASWVVVLTLEPWLEPRLTAMVLRIAARIRTLPRAEPSA